MYERQETLRLFPTDCLNHSFLGEAGRDHRGAVQRSGPGRNPVSSKCWGVGRSPGRMVGHWNADHSLTIIIYFGNIMHSENDTCEPRWGLAPETRSPLREWLCVDKLEMCCPQDHYGPKCQPCGVLGLGDKVRCQDNNCLCHFFLPHQFLSGVQWQWKV